MNIFDYMEGGTPNDRILNHSVPSRFNKSDIMEYREIFVFGSNLAGIHGAGAALHARKHYGAQLGEGIGLTGLAYAIPTKNELIETMPLPRIKPHIDVFIDYARQHPNWNFLLTHIGCGLAGYDWDMDIRPLFPETLPRNVIEQQPYYVRRKL